MDKKNKNLHEDKWLKDIPLRSEIEGFKQDEMISCSKCQRNNPPTRLSCLYCGVNLEFDEQQSQKLKPVLRKIESDANGYNLIYLGRQEKLSDSQLSEVSRMTGLSIFDLENIFGSDKCLPIARAETERETKIVSQRLNEIGIETRIFSDVDFALKNLPKRLRRIEFVDDKLIFVLFNNDEIAELKTEDLSLIVVGGIFEKKLESTEKPKKNKDNKIVETSEISSDEKLVDIYTDNELVGFRVSQNGFDFSCLGKEKKFLANENIKIMISKLKQNSQKIIVDNDYSEIRKSLTKIWDVEERKDSIGLKRRTFGGLNQHKVTSTNNLLQFTKYSRLQRLVLGSGE